MKKIILLFLLITLSSQLVTAQTKDTIKVMVYNLLNYPDGANCTGSTLLGGRADTLKKIIDYVEPDVLMVCELQHVIGGWGIKNSILNTNGRSGYEMATYVPNGSSSQTNLNNAFYYNSNKLGLVKDATIRTDLRDIGVYQLYGKNPDSLGGTAYIDFMVGHLKASDSPTDEARRARAADSIRKYIDTAFVERNLIVGGDFNIYNGTEAAFQTLTNSGTYPLKDPIGAPSSWHQNSSWSFMHTQSTRTSSQKINCGANGGIDDRFDLMLTSNSVFTGTNYVRFLPGTYKALGNSGNMYNDNINDFWNNSGVPKNILNALYYMSDHLPVILEIEITHPPAVGIDKINLADFKLNLYPNPASERLSIQYTLPKEAPVTIAVVDVLGRIVFSRNLGMQQGGNMSELTISDLPKGIYSLVLQTPDAKQQQLFVKK